MLSRSTHTIAWIRPDLAEEEWEFFRHPAKQPFYQRHGIDWERLQEVFDRGEMVCYPRSDRIGEIPVELAYHSYDDFLRYLAKARRNYRLSYNRLENALQRDGTLTLKAPIVLCCSGEALLFSGWRRLCLAWNYGMAPWVWLVTLEPSHPESVRGEE
jgi:hypothetical protein